MSGEEKKLKKSLRINKWFIIIPAAMVALCFLIFAAASYYLALYEGRVYPGVMVGDTDIGGMTKREVKNFIENINNRYANEGIDLLLGESGNEKHVKISTVISGDSAVETVRIDSDQLSQAAISVARNEKNSKRWFGPLLLRLASFRLGVPVIINDKALRGEVISELSGFEDGVRNATVKNVTENGRAEIVSEKSGSTFDYDAIIRSVKSSVEKLSFRPVVIERKQFSPTVTKVMVEAILPNLEAILRFGPIRITVNTGTEQRYWEVTEREIARLVGVRSTEDGRAMFNIDKNLFENYLKNAIAPEVERPAKNARFTVENNKVIDFEEGTDGMAIDVESTYRGFNDLFEVRNSLILHNTTTDVSELVLKVVKPEINLGNSNDLGVVEFLGSGTSTFKDSHTRRIQNIAHAVERLNGTIIKPGEEFSSVKYAGPFTLENGYLPESVIKGKTLKDEVGGGMCQIGTTLFRMAMQTGLPITERHNHSLVVSYYADPVNGNPGTDATLYEPILDLKFLNDTGNHLLLLTEIDFKKQLLTFSLWGTKDGRSGSYTRPKVSKWIPAPVETEYVISSTDADGKPLKSEKCQVAFRGAVASFTYTRVTPEGEKIERVFDSYYRPLPKICTVPPSSTPSGASSTAR